jgi:outer membrane protein assembly factor BamB
MKNACSLTSWCLVFWATAGGFITAGSATGGEDATADENWPAWRGDGSGVSPQTGLPTVWSETQNVLWRTALPGEGNSSPVVYGDRVFLTAALDEGARRVILCLDARRGTILWQSEVPRDAKTTFYAKTGYASPTPATDGRRVYVFFDSPGLVALDMQGHVEWTVHLGPFQTPYNMASSPMLYRDTVIQSCDHRGQAFLLAVDRATGRQRWRTPRPSSGFGHFGTPLLIQVRGRPQLVVNGEPVIAYDPESGRELWTCHGNRECVTPSPVFGEGLVFASSGRIGPVIRASAY